MRKFVYNIIIMAQKHLQKLKDQAQYRYNDKRLEKRGSKSQQELRINKLQ